MSVNVKLSIMMFLQYFIWGAWYVTVGNYMSNIGMGSITHWAYTVSPIAAIVSPFFLGMVADRFFATEKVLSILHILGGVSIFIAPMVAEGTNANPFLFILFLLLNMLCYMPTVALTNSLAFRNMTNQEKQFPIIRVFGTIGWIIAGIFVSRILNADLSAIPLQVAGIAGIIMGLFCLILPHTPPPAKGEKVDLKKVIGIEAFKKIQSKPFNVFLFSSFLLCIPLAVYYNFAPIFVNDFGIENPAFKMSFGQMSEAIFILMMPFLFTILGIKKMLITGMIAWVLRYTLFAIGAPDEITWMIIFGIVLHGICYDFFFVAGFIYVDKKAAPDIRAQAQGFVVLATYGLGMLIGAQVAGFLYNNIVIGNTVDLLIKWQNFWIVPAVLALIVTIFFIIFFNDKEIENKV